MTVDVDAAAGDDDSVQGTSTAVLPPTIIALRSTPPTRTIGQVLLLVAFGVLPATVLPIGWFWSTHDLSTTTASLLLVVAGLAAIGFAARTLWLPKPAPIVVDDEHVDVPFGRQRLRFRLDELFSVRLYNKSALLLSAVPPGAVARGFVGAAVLPPRSFAAPSTPQMLVDAVRARIARRADGELRLAHFDRVDVASAKQAAQKPLVTWVVTAVCVVIFLLEMSSPTRLRALVDGGGNLSTAVLGGEAWRVVTANLLHASLVHLAMNMSGLVSTGALIERWLGRWPMVIVLFATGVGGQLSSTIIAALDGTPRLSVGISGAIFGLLGLLLVSTLRFRKAGVGGLRIPAAGWVLLLVTNGAISLIPIVDVVAHVGGFVFGVVVGLFVVPRPGKAAPLKKEHARVVGIAVVVVTLVAVARWAVALSAPAA